MLLDAPRGRRWLLAGYLAAAIVYMLFLVPWGHDTWFHLQRLLDVQGQFAWSHPRAYLAVNAADGKGIPVWIYYSQWIYWPAMFLASLGLSPLVALKLIYGAFLLLCWVGCHRLLRLHVDPTTAVLGSLLFMTANYTIGEVLVRSAYAEFLSVAWLPFLLVAMHRKVVDDDRWAGPAIALLGALMILPHLLSFMNAGVALAAYGAYLHTSRHVQYRRFLRLIPGFVLALALTAFFWLPAVIETRYVLGADGVPTPIWQTFLSVKRYFNFSGITNLGLVLTVSIPVVAGCLLLRQRRPEVPSIRASWPLLAGFLAYVCLTLHISEPLYRHVPLLQSNLWVWRVLFPMTLLAVLFVTVNLPALPPRLRSDRVLGLVAAVAVLQAAALVPWNTATELSLRPFPVRDIEARIEAESHFKDGFGIDEYLPNPNAIRRMKDACQSARTVPTDASLSMDIMVTAADRCIRVPRYWNTRYVATLDDASIPVFANDSGEILLATQGRAGTVSLRFVTPPYGAIANVVSLIAAAVWVVCLVRARRRPVRPQVASQ